MARAVRALAAANVRYAICGGVALILSGRDRSTRDLDAIVELDRDALVRLKESLREEGFSHHDRADRRELEGVVLYRFWLPIRQTGLSASFDVHQPADPFHHAVVARARTTRLHGQPVCVAIPADLILLKLSANRPVDRADAIDLLFIHKGQIALEALRRQAEELGILDRLEEALSVAESETES